jgi:hypothetical protein
MEAKPQEVQAEIDVEIEAMRLQITVLKLRYCGYKPTSSAEADSGEL